MKNLLLKVKFQFVLLLLRIYFFAQRTALEKAIKLRNMCTLVLDYELRILEPSLLQLGEKEGDDKLVEYVARILTQRQMIDAIEDEAHARSELSAKLIDRARTASKTREVISTFFLAESFLASLLKNEAEKSRKFELAQEFNSSAQTLDVKAIYKSYARLYKRKSVVGSELAERSAIKIDFRLSDVSGLLGVISTIFVISGYLHTSILLGAFGIDSTLFFSLTDYLSASIEQLRHAAVSAVFSIVFFVVGMRHGSMRSKLQIESIVSIRQRKFEGYFFTSIVLASLIRIVLGQIQGAPQFNDMLVLGGVAAFWLGDKISRAYFVKRLHALISIVALLTFATSLGVSLYKEIYELKSGQWKERGMLQVSFKVLPKNPMPPLTIIAANSNYVFAIDKDRVSYVIPRDNLRLAEITSP